MWLVWLRLFLVMNSIGGLTQLVLSSLQSILLQIGLEPYRKMQVPLWLSFRFQLSYKKLPELIYIECFQIIIYWSFLLIVSLVGQSASPEVLQKLTYLVIQHHPQIKRVDTVRAYTFGVLYFVEVSLIITIHHLTSLIDLEKLLQYYQLALFHFLGPNNSGWYWAARRFTIERSSYNWRIIAD